MIHSLLAPHILATHQVTKYFAHHQAPIILFEQVSITFEQGKSYALTGASGSGKSTFMHLLAGIDTPNAGYVSYNERNIATLSGSEKTAFLSSAVGLMFQQPYLIAELSVIENVMMPGLIGGNSKVDCLPAAHELLVHIGLEHKADHKPGSLSGGQQQRIALARALFNKPAFLLADEPTGSLDVKTGQEIVALLIALQTQYHMGIIISTHDTYIANAMQHHYQIVDKKWCQATY